MRIDLPLCDMSDCKWCADGNCTATEVRRVRCPYLHYTDLAEHGRLKELPCGVGDYVTYTDKYSKHCFRVDEIGVDERGIKLISLWPERTWYYFSEHPERFKVDDGANRRRINVRLAELEEK